ncbi:MAG: hypothetical protein Q8Q19_15375, partial [Microbacterium sp.]|nr:hypothetical protein [Microbacterium sp.]
PGDVLVFSLLTLHRGGTSATRTRMSCDFRFSPFQAPLPVNTTTLNERDYDWEDVYHDWESDLAPPKYYWKGHPAGLVSYDTRYDEWRNREALVRGRAGEPEAIRGLEFLVWGATGTVSQQKEAEQILEEVFGFIYE